MIFLQKLSITPFSAFSINDWTVNMIFITVIGGIGRVEGPILGTVIYFVLREFLADFASVYLIILGVVAIAVMLKARRGYGTTSPTGSVGSSFRLRDVWCGVGRRAPKPLDRYWADAVAE
jgi:ABC-type branched-subunit amino acid transport system permease subunit